MQLVYKLSELGSNSEGRAVLNVISLSIESFQKGQEDSERGSLLDWAVVLEIWHTLHSIRQTSAGSS
jgi:hypothetical protein